MEDDPFLCRPCDTTEKKMRYDKKYLDKYVEENKFELIGEYEDVNSKTKIKGKCKTNGCDGEFKKVFSHLLKKGKPLCLNCTNVHKKHKTKNTKKNLGIITNVDKIFEIIKDENIQLLGNYDLSKLNNKSIIIGKCKNELCVYNFNKTIHNLCYKNSGFYCKKCINKNNMETQGKKIYNYDTLKKFIVEKKIILLEDYSDKKIKGTTKIKGICNSNNCNEIFEKGLKYLITKECPYCEKCVRIKLSDDRDCLSFTYDDLIQYCGKNNIILSRDYSSIKVKNYTIIDGKCNTINCNNSFNKQFRVLVKSTGPYCKDCTNKLQIEKCKITNTEIYGETSAMKTKKTKEKRDNTNLKKFGVVSAMKLNEFKQKQKITRESNNGVDGGIFYEVLCKMKDKYKLELLGDHTTINSKSIIRGKCIMDGCQGIFEKVFQTLRYKQGGFYCDKCTKINMVAKISKTKLEKYGCETCKINLVYDLFTNLDCERICSDCSNPKRNPKYQKTKEWLVVRKLREDIPDIEFIHNKSVGNECTLQDRENTNGHLYPDIRFELYGFDLIVEVDEHKHRGADYSCDERRMYEIIKELGLPCVFIRYNPDDKKSDYNELLKKVKYYLEKDMDEIDFDENSGLKVEYLFYD